MRLYAAGPDGGWGWMVCLGTFLVAFVVEGTTAAFGVIIIQIQEEFDASKSSTTWVASVSFGTCYIIGLFIFYFTSCCNNNMVLMDCKMYCTQKTYILISIKC